MYFTNQQFLKAVTQATYSLLEADCPQAPCNLGRLALDMQY